MAHPQSLAELLSDQKIHVKSQRAGHTEQVMCPQCEGFNRTREISLSVSIDADGLGATWNCHRGSCGWKSGARVRTEGAPGRYVPRDEPVRPIQKPTQHPPSVRENVPDWLHAWFGERNIGARTIKAFGVYSTTRMFNGLGERPAIVFPYVSGGELANRKYRPHPEKQPQQQDKDALQTLFNVDRLGPDPAEIVFVEGEPDVMAMFEVGIEHAVSIKDGAGAQANFREDDKRFESLRTHADMLAKARRIILAGDMDAPGLALREELARRLGRHRCWLVTWPEGCKDACDVLRRYGTEAVIGAVKSATPYPIAGLQRIQTGTLLALRKLTPPAVMSTGARATDRVMALPTEGRLIVVTGWPGSGKTSWVRFVMVHTAAAEHHRKWAVFSPEMQPWELFAAECAEVFHGKPFWPKADLPGMTDQEVMHAEQWLGDRMTMIVSDAEDDAPTLDWVLDKAKMAVLRDGVTDFVLDPWNEVNHERGTMSETDYTGRALQRIKAFGLRYGCNVWLIVHPAKPPALKGGEVRGAPGPYDISGSAHYFNKADMGITVHSPAPGGVEVHIWKTRHRRWGTRSAMGALDFDALTGRYSTPIGYDG